MSEYLREDEVVVSIKKAGLVYQGDKAEVIALKEVDLDIVKGEFICVLGPSGCGKSTLLNIIAGFHQPTSGHAMMGDEEIVKPDWHRGVVFQTPTLYPWLNIYDNVAFGLKIQGINKKKILDERVENALKEAAIWDEVKDKLSCNACSLSGGQQQRICIARALATNPEILLMDEPTSALDPISAAKVEETILFLKKQHTIILVTHNIEQAKRVSDNLAFFMSGHLIEYGVSRDIFTQAKNKDTKDYLEGKWS